MSNRVVAVITKKIVGGVFPVGVHDPLVHPADNLGSPGPAIEHNAELPLLTIEIFQQRRGFLIEGGEDKSLENVQLRYRDQTPLVHVQLPEVNFFHTGDANQSPLCVVRPTVIAAHEVLRIPLISSTHPVASVPAHVQESPYPSVGSPTQQYRIFPHVGSDEIVRIGDLALVTQVEPTARKNSL